MKRNDCKRLSLLLMCVVLISSFAFAASAETAADDFGNTFSTAYNWGFNPIGIKTLTGNLEVADDIDMFKFTAPITGTYTIYSSDIMPDIKAWLYNSSQIQIAMDDDSGGDRNFKIIMSLEKNQVYYLKVSHCSQSGTGTYTINLAMDDYGDYFYNAYNWKLYPGDNRIEGNINFTGDVDMFKFTAPVTGTYHFGTDPVAIHQVILYNSSSQEIASYTASRGYAGYSMHFDYDFVQGQTYYFKFSGSPGYGINITVPA